MKPSVEDQLQGTCRILETVVAPCVADPMARTILDGLVANLRMLIGAFPAVPSFLRQDNQATAQLLAALEPSLERELAARVAASRAEPEPDPADTSALDQANHRLRALLSEAVCSEGLSPDQHQTIVQHMTARASRVPMRYVPTAPSANPTP